MTIEDLDTCARCGAQAQLYLYPTEKWPDGRSYITDCINASCVRVHVSRPQYRTKEEAAHAWNEEQAQIRNG